MTYTVTLTADQVTWISKAIHTQINRCQQRKRCAAKRLKELRPELQASRVRDALLIAGGVQDLPGTTGELRNAVRHRKNMIAHLALKITAGAALLEQFEALEQETKTTL